MFEHLKDDNGYVVKAKNNDNDCTLSGEAGDAGRKDYSFATAQDW